jgi:hypothetical protein
VYADQLPTNAHPLDQLGCDAFGIDHGLICGHVEVQVLLMHAAKHPQVGPKRRPHSLAGVAVDFAAAIPISIPCPFMVTMANRGMVRMTPPIALPLVGIELRAAGGHVLCDQGSTCTRIGMVADPEALLTCVPRYDANNWRTVIGVGPMPSPLIGTPPGRILGVRMGRAFFPPRSGTVRRPQRPCQA